MTVTSKGTKPNGEAFNDSITLQRTSGGPGLAGKWKSTEVKSSTEMWDISPNGDDGLTMKIVDFNAICTMKFDGKDYPATGPTVPKNFTLAVKKTGARSLEMTEKMDGKVISMDTFTISADGKTLTDDAVPAGTTEKIKAVYDKQ
jgi:transketolase